MSNKGKNKLIDENEEEEEDLNPDKELDYLLKICKELEALEAAAKIAKVTLETQKSLFHPWSIKRIQKEAIDNPIVYWLEPAVSLVLHNEAYSQFDFPITPRDFMFWCFDQIEKSLISDNEVNLKIFNLYLKNAKPQYQY